MILKISFLRYGFVLRLVCLSLLIVIIGFSITVSFAEDEIFIPNWIKKMAGLLSQNELSDKDFLNGLTYLIENDLLHVEKFENFKLENENLKSENILLLNEIGEMSKQSESLKITLHTSKSEYGSTDNIVIFGTVNQLIDNQKVSVVVSSPRGSFMSIVKVSPNIDGSYAFVTNDPEFKELGEYVINVYYAGQVYATTSYTFNPKL